MTGEQIIGAAGVVAGRIVHEAAKDMRETDQTIRKELVAAAKDTEPFRHGAHIRARRIAAKEAVFLQVFRPIRKMLGLSAEYFEYGFEDDMRPRVEVIPAEHRVAPKPSIAAPAMQGLAFSLDEPELRKLYLDLLASASDDRRNKGVHPAFVEVIRQLTAEEIPVLTYPLATLALAAASVVGKTKEGAQLILRSHLLEVVDTCPGLDSIPELLPTYVDNWVRLGLVDVQYDEHLARAAAYDWVEEHPDFKAAKENQRDPVIISVEFVRGILRPTAFGVAFAKAVGMEKSEAYLDYINEQVQTSVAAQEPKLEF
jgi:hypothetical protein